jgi:hypothetical protein
MNTRHGFGARSRCGMLAALAVMALATAGCGTDNVHTGQTAINDGNITDETVKNLNKGQPLPVYTYSTEREQLIKRHNLWNQKDVISYIALINQGKVFRTCTVRGKVSSMNSLLTNPQQLVYLTYGSGDHTYEQMPSPDLDGSYGDNPPGVFFWTTDGEYVEWAGQGSVYILSSRPFTLQTPPEVNVSVR